MSKKMLITEFGKWANPSPVGEKSRGAGRQSLSSFQQRNMMPPLGSKIISKRKLPCPPVPKHSYPYTGEYQQQKQMFTSANICKLYIYIIRKMQMR